jgi:hypothetical protein
LSSEIFNVISVNVVQLFAGGKNKESGDTVRSLLNFAYKDERANGRPAASPPPVQ